jgi:hypothetical protein
LNNSAGGFRATTAGAAAGSTISANVSGGFNPGQHAAVGVSGVTTDSIANFRYAELRRVALACGYA